MGIEQVLNQVKLAMQCTIDKTKTKFIHTLQSILIYMLELPKQILIISVGLINIYNRNKQTNKSTIAPQIFTYNIT